jgi:hypothetical protein
MKTPTLKAFRAATGAKDTVATLDGFRVHAFTAGQRRKITSVRAWPERGTHGRSAALPAAARVARKLSAALGCAVIAESGKMMMEVDSGKLGRPFHRPGFRRVTLP